MAICLSCTHITHCIQASPFPPHMQGTALPAITADNTCGEREVTVAAAAGLTATYY